MSVFKQLLNRRMSDQEDRLNHELDNLQRVMEDEAFQNSLLDDKTAAEVARGDSVDALVMSSGAFGFDPENPIPVNGPLGAVTYLSRLKTHSGERLLFQCVGRKDGVRVFECVTYSGRRWFVLFLHIYHPRKSTFLPDGFEFSGDVAMFSGFVDASLDFPKDYQQRVDKLDDRIKAAYATQARLGGNIGASSFVRPLAHWAKLDALAVRGFR